MERIFTYGGSWRGLAHVENDKPCQDASCFFPIDRNLYAIAIADGVGSSKNSEIASGLAISVVKDFLQSLSDKMRSEPGELPILAMTIAADQVKLLVEESKGLEGDYDTTLSIAIFDVRDGSIYIAHSGDGGFIGLRNSGIFESLTEPIKGEFATSVYPLRYREEWRTGSFKGPYVALMGMTDGVLEKFMPSLLSTQDEKIYVRKAAWFSDIKFIEGKPGNEKWDQEIEKRLKYIATQFYESTPDDLTLIVLLDTDKEADYVSDDYYSEPKWVLLKQTLEKNLYPPSTREVSGDHYTVSSADEGDESPNCYIYDLVEQRFVPLRR